MTVTIIVLLILGGIEYLANPKFREWIEVERHTIQDIFFGRWDD